MEGCSLCDPQRKATVTGSNMRTAEPRAANLKRRIYRPGSRADLATVPSRTLWHDNIAVERLS